jgi:multiple sugar transport system permease protein
MAEQTSTMPEQYQEPKRANVLYLGQSQRKTLRLLISYIFLGVGALFMLFPVFWMLTSALKPEWQIFIRPIMWIPQHWHKVEAGDTVRYLNLWDAPAPNGDGEQESIVLGTRRYIPVIPLDALPEIIAAPRDEVSDATEESVGDEAVLNVRDWQGERVVAIDSDGDNLLLIRVDDITEVVVLLLDLINAGERVRPEVEGYELKQVREVDLDGQVRQLLQLSPQIQLRTVAPSESAGQAIRLPAEQLSDSEVLPLGSTEIEQYTLASDESGERYVLLDQSDWRPTMDINLLHERAFTVPETDFVVDGEREFNQGVFPVGTYTDAQGNSQEVAMIMREEMRVEEVILVMPTEYMDQVILVPSASLERPFLETVDRTSIRVKDFTLPTVRDETINMDMLPDAVGIIGNRQEMVLLVPVNAVDTAYDVVGEDVDRKTTLSFKYKNFFDAMARKVGAATFLDFFKNSIIVAGLSIIGHLFSCTLVAYAFARLRAPGKRYLFGIVLATMMLPWHVTLIPVYKIYRDMHMIDSLWPLFIQAFFGNAFLIFLLRQFFSTIPMELEEAARIDGAGRVQTFARIMLPLVMPALATVTIFTFMWSWNDLFRALLYLNSPENYTVAIGLQQFVGAYEAEFNLLMAAATVAMLPTVLLFFFAQRFFIEGITLTGLKG